MYTDEERLERLRAAFAMLDEWCATRKDKPDVAKDDKPVYTLPNKDRKRRSS